MLSSLICNFLNYSYKRLVMIKKIIKSFFFKKKGFMIQNNIKTPLLQASASHPESSTRVKSLQNKMECHKKKDS